MSVICVVRPKQRENRADPHCARCGYVLRETPPLMSRLRLRRRRKQSSEKATTSLSLRWRVMLLAMSMVAMVVVLMAVAVYAVVSSRPVQRHDNQVAEPRPAADRQRVPFAADPGKDDRGHPHIRMSTRCS